MADDADHALEQLMDCEPTAIQVSCVRADEEPTDCKAAATFRMYRVRGTVHSTLGFDEWVAEFDEWVDASSEHYARIIGENGARSHFGQRNKVNGQVPEISEVRVTQIIDLGVRYIDGPGGG